MLEKLSWTMPLQVQEKEYFQYSGMWVIEDPAVIYVGECFAYVLL